MRMTNEPFVLAAWIRLTKPSLNIWTAKNSCQPTFQETTETSGTECLILPMFKNDWKSKIRKQLSAEALFTNRKWPSTAVEDLSWFFWHSLRWPWNRSFHLQLLSWVTNNKQQPPALVLTLDLKQETNLVFPNTSGNSTEQNSVLQRRRGCKWMKLFGENRQNNVGCKLCFHLWFPNVGCVFFLLQKETAWENSSVAACRPGRRRSFACASLRHPLGSSQLEFQQRHLRPHKPTVQVTHRGPFGSWVMSCYLRLLPRNLQQGHRERTLFKKVFQPTLYISTMHIFISLRKTKIQAGSLAKPAILSQQFSLLFFFRIGYVRLLGLERRIKYITTSSNTTQEN